MRKFNVALLIVLVVQAALVAVMYTGQGQADATTVGPWLSIDQNKLSQLVISDNKGDSVTLKQGKHGWVVPTKSGFPADASRLKAVISSLDEARNELPVAVSSSAQKRFRVADDAYERHLVFKTRSGQTISLYLGKNAGAGRVYARLDGKDAIQSLRFPMWRLSTKVSDWLDRKSLALKAGKQKKIELPNVTLVHSKNLWQPQGLADDRIPDSEQIQVLLSRLHTLRWQKLDGKKSEVELPAQPDFTMTAMPDKGEALVYRFYKKSVPARPNESTGQQKSADKGENKSKNKIVWQVTRSDSDFVFTVDDDRVEPLQKANKQNLSQPKQSAKGAKQPVKGSRHLLPASHANAGSGHQE